MTPAKADLMFKVWTTSPPSPLEVRLQPHQIGWNRRESQLCGHDGAKTWLADKAPGVAAIKQMGPEQHSTLAAFLLLYIHGRVMN